MGRESLDHLKDIEHLLYDTQWFVRSTAAEALTAVGPKGHERLEIHFEGIQSPVARKLGTKLIGAATKVGGTRSKKSKYGTGTGTVSVPGFGVLPSPTPQILAQQGGRRARMMSGVGAGQVAFK